VAGGRGSGCEGPAQADNPPWQQKNRCGRTTAGARRPNLKLEQAGAGRPPESAVALCSVAVRCVVGSVAVAGVCGYQRRVVVPRR